MNRRSLLLCILLFFSTLQLLANGSQNRVINLADYLVKNGDRVDASFAVSQALADCKKNKAAKLIIPKGTYHFYPDMASEAYMFISNNDEGLKRIAFLIEGLSDFTVDGQGSTFIFHGYICPFIVKSSNKVSLKNFRIDWQRTFHSEAKIVNVYKDSLDISFSTKYPYAIKNDLLFFSDSSGISYPYKSLLEFDTQKRETAFKVKDYYAGPYAKAKRIDEATVRLFVPTISASRGNTMVFFPSDRLCPAITLSQTNGIKINDVSILHAGGMGVIAQMCSDIILRNVSVTPSPGRIVSTTADATHFVNCYGSIKIDSCLFENQGDDATNIHGIYTLIESQPDSKSIIVRLKHYQQYGQKLFIPGDSIEFVNRNSLVSYCYTRVDSVKPINKEFTQLFLSSPVPENSEGNAIASLKYPEVLISNCIIQNNRARGLLLGSRANITIRGNYFHTPGAAILFEGDVNYWFEQAGVRKVTITENRFENCNYGIWGHAIIQSASRIAEQFRNDSRYNQNIHVYNNTIKRFDPRIVNIYSVKGFKFFDNKIIDSKDYANINIGAEPFITAYCKGLEIEK